MSSPLKQNTTTIQELLDTINSLPTAETLDTELNAQSNLISEQDAKIAELAQVLAGKAGGDSKVKMIEVTHQSSSISSGVYCFNSSYELVNVAIGSTVSALGGIIIYTGGNMLQVISGNYTAYLEFSMIQIIKFHANGGTFRVINGGGSN